MFKLNEKFEVNRRIFKSYYITHSTADISTKNEAKFGKYINTRKEDSIISLLNSYFDYTFAVRKKADNSRYEYGNDIRLVKLGPIAFFNK